MNFTMSTDTRSKTLNIYIYCLNSWVRIAKLPSFHLLPMWPSPSLDLESFSCLYQSFSHSSFAVKEILYQNVRICMTFRFFPTSKKRKGMNSIRKQWGCKAFQQISSLLSLFILLTDVRSNSVGKNILTPITSDDTFLYDN